MKHLLFLIPLLLTACDDLPKDPEGSLDRIQTQKILKIGIVENKPWAAYENGRAEGIEAKILEDFADSLNVEPQWRPISHAGMLDALKDGDLDIAIGGFCNDMEGKDKISPTRAYLKEENCKHVIGVHTGENRLLVTLEKFLHEKEPFINQLAAEAP